jgi:endogenous inhibitor of DNA gyrase (YacG/DUF329 family)
VAARKCPICDKTVERAPEEVLPFCSRACKLADLGRWLDGAYRVPGPPLELDMGADGLGGPSSQNPMGTEDQ